MTTNNTLATATQAVSVSVGLPSLLTPDNCALLMIDHQSLMALAVQSIDRALLTGNVAGLAKTGKLFNLPTVLTTAVASRSGPLIPELQSVFPNQTPIDRTTMNAWEDDNFRAAVVGTGRKKLVMAGLWTEVCIAMAGLSALGDDYEVYVVTDACGGVSLDAHQQAVQRLVQAGVIPVTWMSVLLELQRDWARGETAAAAADVAIQQGGGFAIGLGYEAALLAPAAQ